MKPAKQTNTTKRLYFLKRLDDHTDRNKMYYTLLASSVFFGFIYLISLNGHRLIDYLHMPWITNHISNLLGTMFLMVLISGKAAFKGRSIIRPYIAAAALTTMNLILELSKPIDTLTLPLIGQWEHFNTSDPLDALFGILGILIVFAIIRIKQNQHSSMKSPSSI